MSVLPDGKYHDVLTRADGRRSDFGWRSNIVVDQCRELLAAFMLGETALGIQNIRLGRGLPVWDSVPPGPNSAGTTTLVDAAPVTIAAASAAMQLDFIDATGNVIAAPSHRIQVTLTLTPGSLPIVAPAVYPLREFGLFGRLNGVDRMIDYVRHPVMNIGAGDTLTRRIRLVF